jgi:hypothetical protein
MQRGFFLSLAVSLTKAGLADTTANKEHGNSSVIQAIASMPNLN